MDAHDEVRVHGVIGLGVDDAHDLEAVVPAMEDLTGGDVADAPGEGAEVGAVLGEELVAEGHRRPRLSVAPPPTTKVAWSLVGGPCAGEYDAMSTWPPPERIRAVHGGGLLGDGPPAVLDLPGDEPEPGEEVVEYVRASYGFACSRGRGGKQNLLTGLYMPAWFSDRETMRALRVSAGIDPELSAT